MKKLILTIAICALTSAVAFGQGQINFTNFAPPGVDAQVTDLSGAALDGADWTAVLSVGASADSLTAVATQDGFLSGAGAGYFLGGTVTVDGLAGGSSAFAQVSYAGNGQVGATDVIGVTLGGPGTPPTPPSNLTGLNAVQLALVPEPSTILLGLLGAAAMLFRRRK
jgi:hypothetical protein